MPSPNIKYNYEATVRYSADDDGYIARIPAFAHCTGFGETPQVAVTEAYDALGGILEVMEKSDLPIPDPDTTARRLRKLKGIIKMSHLAKQAGIKPSTLASKVERGGPFSASERERIEGVLALD